jgi:hypothetical protein
MRCLNSSHRSPKLEYSMSYENSFPTSSFLNCHSFLGWRKNEKLSQMLTSNSSIFFFSVMLFHDSSSLSLLLSCTLSSQLGRKNYIHFFAALTFKKMFIISSFFSFSFQIPKVCELVINLQQTIQNLVSDVRSYLSR